MSFFLRDLPGTPWHRTPGLKGGCAPGASVVDFPGTARHCAASPKRSGAGGQVCVRKVFPLKKVEPKLYLLGREGSLLDFVGNRIGEPLFAAR
jgi:hypothetical protein